MQPKRRVLHLLRNLFLAGLFLCVIVCGGPYAYLVWLEEQDKAAWEEYLSLRLNTRIVADLCEKGLIPESMGDCDDPTLRLEQRDVPDLFRLNLADDATFADATRLFGDYVFICYMEENPYNCQYRIDAYDVVLYFDPTTDRIISWRLESPGS